MNKKYFVYIGILVFFLIGCGREQEISKQESYESAEYQKQNEIDKLIKQLGYNNKMMNMFVYKNRFWGGTL